MPPIQFPATSPAEYEIIANKVSASLPPPEYQVPEPRLSIWARIMLQSPERHAEKMKMMCVFSAATLGRQPTQDEVNALSEIAYKEARTVSWITPLTFVVGGCLAWRTRGTYGFPFYQPKFKIFNPNAWPITRAPILQNHMAQRAWHHMRFAAYCTTGFFAVAPFVAVYASGAAMTASRQDERLKDFRRDMKPGQLLEMAMDRMTPTQLAKIRRDTVANIEIMERNRARLPSEEAIARGKSPEEATKRVSHLRNVIEEGDARLAELRETLKHVDQHLAQRQNVGSAAVDMDTQNRDYETLSGASSPADFSLPAEPSRSPRPGFAAPQEPPAQSSRPGWGEQSSSSQQSWESGQAASGGWDVDDASPVAPTARSAPQQPTESAWERLRRSSKPPPRASEGDWQDAQGQQGQTDNSGGGFAYDRADEERQLAKEKAQKEFDEMLERERRGDGQDNRKNSGW